jgi:DNA-binding transcriptional ArsR family regulator
MENQNQNNLMTSQNQNSKAVRADIGVLFSGDSYGLFIFQKTEKIVKAVYLLSGLMPEREPMRERTRALANKMLDNSLSMSNRVWGEETYKKNLLSAIGELVVLFDVAESAKMLSKMNHQIITTELRKLTDFIVASSSNYSSAKIAFEPNIFDGDYNYIPEQNFKTPSAQIIKTDTDKNDPVTVTNISYKGQKENTAENQKNNQSSSNEKMSVIKTVAPEKIIKNKNNRQDVILSMLKSGGKLTIKDFAQNIKDCSEKTIQRELLSLVSKGLLKKEGERRWSKYFLSK